LIALANWRANTSASISFGIGWRVHHRSVAFRGRLACSATANWNFSSFWDKDIVRQIAEMLFVSSKTVEAHREHIKQKMNFKSSNELLRYAIQYTLNDG
jgi:hypothetical protein